MKTKKLRKHIQKILFEFFPTDDQLLLRHTEFAPETAPVLDEKNDKASKKKPAKSSFRPKTGSERKF